MEKTHWKKLTNPDYLGAYALEPNQDLIAQIDRVGQEMINSPDGKKEECTVAHFKDKTIKPMILNVTNCKVIAKLYDTPFIEDWKDKYISIYIAKVRAFGDVVEALRIRKRIPSIKEFKCVDCGCVIKGAGSKTAEDIANLSRTQYGRALCVGCARKEMDKLRAEKEKVEKKENE